MNIFNEENESPFTNPMYLFFVIDYVYTWCNYQRRMGSYFVELQWKRIIYRILEELNFAYYVVIFPLHQILQLKIISRLKKQRKRWNYYAHILLLHSESRPLYYIVWCVKTGLRTKKQWCRKNWVHMNKICQTWQIL